MRYSVEARKEKMSKDMNFYNLQEFYPTNMGKLLDTAKCRARCCKNCIQKAQLKQQVNS